jgi:hypothetical protein
MSWDAVLSEIRQVRAAAKTDTLWYRGHWSSSYTLLPSLLRSSAALQKEQILFQKYVQAAAHLGRSRASDWESLFDMQHYGIPTRLLDWTETLGVAVFFALGTQPSEGAIYILDPRKLNERSTGMPEPKRINDEHFKYRSVYWKKEPFAARLPIAIEPPFQNDRMFAQRGMFTIHGEDIRPLDEQYPECVARILLPVSARKGAKEFLHFASLNELSIFPDMVGVAAHIRNMIVAAAP